MNDTIESLLLSLIEKEMTQDLAHDINHVLRVVKTAKVLALREKANLQVVLPAAYLHDCVCLPKNHPERAQSSRLAADKAITLLTTIDYPSDFFDDIHHAIISHSYSANITPQTLEAQIVQDADRLDALGAIGIARCLQVSSLLGITLYHHEDPFCEQRTPDDRHYSIDHFYRKLLQIESTMNTPSAKVEAQHRTQVMRDFLSQLAREL